MELLTNRDLSVLFWLVSFFGYNLVRRPSFRAAAKRLALALIQPYVLVPALILFGYVYGLISLATHVNLWGPHLLEDTLYWVVGVGLVLLADTPDALREGRLLRLRAATTAKVYGVMAAVVNYHVFALPVELILVPSVTLVSLMSIVAHRTAQAPEVKAVADWLLTVTGFGLIGYAVAQFIQGWGGLDWYVVGTTMALPIWLTAGALPFAYTFQACMAYEGVYKYTRVAGLTVRQCALAMLAVASLFHIRVGALYSLPHYRVTEAGHAESLGGARACLTSTRE